jgi:hypothetical protein
MGVRFAAVLAAVLAAFAPSAGAGVPGAAAKARAAMVEQQRALRALSGSYTSALAHLGAAQADLVAIESALAVQARATGPVPNAGRIVQLIDIAYAGVSRAQSALGEGMTTAARGYPIWSTVLPGVRTSIRQGIAASAALAKLVA